MSMEINPSGYKILIVNGVMSNVSLLKVLLTDEKFAIATANNGQQALEQTDKEHPDLVLPDVVMSDLSEFEVTQRLKSNPDTTDIPTIFLAALNSTMGIVKGFQVGTNDFISKSFNKEGLIIHVTHQISLVAAKRVILNKTEELRHTVIGRDKLYSVIAHDLRSPMGSIRMVLNVMVLSLPAEKIGSEMYELLTMANQTAEDIFSLLDNLLKRTRSQIGNLNIVYQDISIVEMVNGMIDIFNIVAGLRKITIREEKTEKLPVSTDVDILKTVIRNLLSNTIRFSNKDSKAVVKVEEQGDMAVISIKDNGCGIDEEGQRRLLHTDTHFSILGASNEKDSELGLLLCQGLVVKNGGKLQSISKKGEGSTFYFSVPLER